MNKEEEIARRSKEAGEAKAFFNFPNKPLDTKLMDSLKACSSVIGTPPFVQVYHTLLEVLSMKGRKLKCEVKMIG